MNSQLEDMLPPDEQAHLDLMTCWMLSLSPLERLLVSQGDEQSRLWVRHNGCEFMLRLWEWPQEHDAEADEPFICDLGQRANGNDCGASL
jgi:hypothetical protein